MDNLCRAGELCGELHRYVMALSWSVKSGHRYGLYGSMIFYAALPSSGKLNCLLLIWNWTLGLVQFSSSEPKF
jgi:hypothetical protein